MISGHLLMVPLFELSFFLLRHSIRIVILSWRHGSFVLLVLYGIEQIGKEAFFQFGEDKSRRKSERGSGKKLRESLKTRLPEVGDKTLTPTVI